MENPRVTVLMPVYNGGKYLNEAIESILHQTLRNFEFLIIDDGSTDGSIEIVNSYGDERIMLESNGKNLGINLTLNKGILMARGKYIARMDCDDISLPERLERQVAFMEDRRDVAVCGSSFEHFGRSDGQVHPPTDCNEINCRLLLCNVMAHPTVFLRKDVMLENALFYDTSFHAAQDYDLWVRISRKFKLANIPEVLLRYRTHDRQVSAYRAEQQKRAASAIRARQLRNLLPDVTEEEILLFDSVAGKTLDKKAALLDGVRLLFEKMIDANKLGKIYDQDVLYNILFRTWWRLCNRCCIEGLDAWKIYRKSSIQARRFDSFKFFLKCGIRYGK